MEKRKRGAIDVSFNWIFVLIAGAAILIFFIVLISNQKDSAESNMAITIRTELSSVFSGASLSQDRNLEIDLPKSTLHFTCDFATCTDFSTSNNPNCYSQYEIGETGINEQTPTEILFAPFDISGQKLFTWTLPWNVPFFVTNFLYISGTTTKFIFVDNGQSEILSLYNKFPERLNKELVPINLISELQPEGNKNFKFIFVNNEISEIDIPEQIISSTESYNINAINIKPSLKQIDFYYFDEEKLDFSGSISYLSEPEIYGAIFSNNLDFYNCNMQKAYNRYHLIARVIAERSTYLYNNADIECKSIYSENINGLAAIKSATLSFTNQNINLLGSSISTLGYANQAAQEKSCPLIY
ncbi:MAG: hypothetical protein KAQ83_03840 [Nanoarchaeota archaeon]|nr:hypothetical protein [Nanoarchaeota archaeon]